VRDITGKASQKKGMTQTVMTKKALMSMAMTVTAMTGKDLISKAIAGPVTIPGVTTARVTIRTDITGAVITPMDTTGQECTGLITPTKEGSIWNVDTYNPFDGRVVDLGGRREAWEPTKPPLGEPYHRTVENTGPNPGLMRYRSQHLKNQRFL